MPIYEYECGACGAVHDVLHKISDSPPRKCPSCGRLKLKRLVSAPRFRLKGEGWYETDFKTGDKRNLVDSGDGEAAKTDSKADATAKDGGADKKAAKAEKKTDAAATKKKGKAGGKAA